MKHRLQMSAVFKKQVTKYLMRHEHLSLEGLVQAGIDASQVLTPPYFRNTFLDSHVEQLPDELDTKENRAIIVSFLNKIDRKSRK